MNIYIKDSEFYILYVKTHNKTGLKYLGFTEKTDPVKYPGSGKRWLKHLEKHGFDYSTEILMVTYSHNDLKFMGKYYSNLWNIVKSKEWANQRPEEGYGGDTVSDKKWITDGIKEKYILKEEDIPEGWVKGRSSKCAFKNPTKQAELSKRSDPLKRKETYRQRKNEGKYENSYKHRKPTFTGKTHNKEAKEKLSAWQLNNNLFKNTKWINNGIEELRININKTTIPDGYILGRLKN